MEKLRCNICGSEKFSTEKHLKRHIKHDHIQDFEYKCLVCSFTSLFLDNTKRHIRYKHEIKKGEEKSCFVTQPRKLSTETIVKIIDPENPIVMENEAVDPIDQSMKIIHVNSEAANLPISQPDVTISMVIDDEQSQNPESSEAVYILNSYTLEDVLSEKGLPGENANSLKLLNGLPATQPNAFFLIDADDQQRVKTERAQQIKQSESKEDQNKSSEATCKCAEVILLLNRILFHFNNFPNQFFL